MKKFLLLVPIAFALGLLSIYFFIPGQLNISSAAVIGASENGTQRFALDKANWPKWWNYSGDSTLSASNTQTDSASLVRPLAGILLAAGVRTALQADFLAVAGRDGVALGRHWLGRADIGFDSDFFGHKNSG